MNESTENEFSEDWAPFIVDRVEIGLFALDKEHRLLLWNQFMEKHSGKKADEVLGQVIYDCFPELPRKWLERKINSVFLLKNFAFTSWEQRPYLFQFAHNRPITGGIDFMQQNSTIMPMLGKDGGIDGVCISLFDVTDTAIATRQLNETKAALEESNNRDGLTGIYNRRYLQEHLLQEFERARRYEEGFALIMFDLDHFKKVNDNYGHPQGDALLRQLGGVIKSVVRPNDTVCRYGGDEFVVILSSADAASAAAFAERFRRRLRDRAEVALSSGTVSITATVGVATFLEDAEVRTAEDLLQLADHRLYEGKRAGRNRVVWRDAPATS